MRNKNRADIGVFGGSGFYGLLEKAAKVEIKTPFGAPSDKITIGEYKGKKVAFLPRHGAKHIYPPHKINYRANLWAFKSLGVKKIIAPSASGSLKPGVRPGDFVIPDQFVNFTNGRQDTFFDGPQTAHISSAEPYCENLRKLAAKSCQKLKIRHHKKGTVVVVQGPRFSTKAESAFFQKQGWAVINMTQYPECVLARELEMCYVNIALITDYDAGLFIAPKSNSNRQKQGAKIKPVECQEAIKVFQNNNKTVKKLIFSIIEEINEKANCLCNNALKNALI